MGAWAKERESCGTFLWKRPQGPHNLQRPFVSPPPPSASLLAASSVTRLQSNSRRPLVARSLQKSERARFGWTRRNLVRFGSSESHIFSFPPKMLERWSKSFSQRESTVGLAEAGGGRRPRLLTDYSLKTSSVRSHDPRILIRKRLIQLQLSSFSPLDRLKLFLNVWLIHIYCFVDLTIITLRPYLWLSLLTAHHCHHWHLLVQLWLISLID